MENKKKAVFIAGVDEAGRGPLAGPVIAAAVILDNKKAIKGLTDSKLLSAKRRDQLYLEIQEKALAWAVGRADVAEIDQLNILQASLLAMERAVSQLETAPHHALIDGTHCPKLVCSAEAVIKGDQTVMEISAASIVAKVVRDREMIKMEDKYPGYGFAAHKGYGTQAHLQALEKLGACPIHRRSFAPVKILVTQKRDC